MSLFNDMTALSKQHAENSGSYTFINPIEPDKPEIDIRVEPEPAPTVSLYNLLDHSVADLAYLLHCVRKEIAFMYPHKKSNANAYTSICAWATILETAHKEACKKDSEAWAEKTAKEILNP